MCVWYHVLHLLQVLKSISDQILFHLNKSESHKDTNYAAALLMKQLEYTIAFAKSGDPAILCSAARDFCFTLAHIYIGKSATFHFYRRPKFFPAWLSMSYYGALIKLYLFVSIPIFKKNLYAEKLESQCGKWLQWYSLYLITGSLLVYHASLEDSTISDKSAALRFAP